MANPYNTTRRKPSPGRRFRNAGLHSAGEGALLTLWSLRMLVRLGGHRRLDTAVMFNGGVLNLAGGVDKSDLSDPPALLAVLAARLQVAESRPRAAFLQAKNVALLGDSLGLSPVDCDILLLSFLLHTNAAFEEIGDTLGQLDRARLIAVLATILDRPRKQIERALSEDGALMSSGLIRIDSSNTECLKGKFGMLRGLTDALSESGKDPLALLREFFAPAPPAELRRDDFEGCRADYDLLRQYLGGALRAGKRGVNILIYGPPGAGKTQLARTLAADLGKVLFEVSVQDQNRMPLDDADRLQRLRLAQRVLGKRRDVLLVFDEIEDVFPVASGIGFLPDVGVHRSKGWINQTLENNGLPTLWIGNHVNQIDRAYLRRFDFVLELTEPSEALRRRLIAKQLAGLPVEPCWIDTLARHRALTPGIVGRVARVVAQLEPANATDAQDALERVTGNLLKAMELPPLAPPQAPGGLPYQVELINAAMDPAAVAAGLARSEGGRLLCYGPPGTGKTAFAAHVAEQLGRPLVTGRASDVLNMYVGGTEQRIRALFAEARAQGAVLLLDEIDGLLRTRDRAERSWELTQVNELLVQIEAFPGVLIACTNLLETLDPAALRRFDLKVRFDCLRPAQAWGLVERILADRGVVLDADAVRARARIEQIGVLTPGDFAAVLRRFRFSGEVLTATSLVEALVHECDYKAEKPRRGIGFVADL